MNALARGFVMDGHRREGGSSKAASGALSPAFRRVRLQAVVERDAIGRTLTLVRMAGGPRIRPTPRVLVTEYSLKPWDTHREDVISPEFIAAAKADPHDEIHPPPVGVKRVWQYINYATMTPRPLAE